ncbi:DNA polymerase I, partial [Candidatus Saccharibacteria bacterium]|nr:DNA polymerase I [Candidatus Saccharibacteria bacterium]NIW79548.1 DNA polymerase I [Calditrichia bacterium]
NPQQIIDFLALMGDSSDNIPGVPKVGQKTAQELLEKFGSLDNLYKNLDKIPKKAIRQSLEENREQANLSRELVTIDIAVPVNRDIQSMTINPLDTEKVVQLFEQLEFRSLITRIQENNNESAPIVGSSAVYDADNQDYQLINTPERLQVLVDQLQQQSFFVFDTETTGLQAFKSEVIGISFCWQKHQAYYVPLNDRNSSLTSGNIIEFLKPIFENPGIKKGGQNIKYDALMLWQHGINLQGTHFDTMIASFLVSPGLRQNNLEALAENYLNYKMISIDTLIGKKGKDQKSMFDISVNQVCPYACEDADITYQLKEILEKKLPEVGTEQLFHAVEMPLVEVLAKMEINGVSLDTKFLEQMSLQ